MPAAKQAQVQWAETMAFPRAMLHPNQLQQSLLLNKGNLAVAGTVFSEGASSSRRRLLLPQPSLHPSRSDRSSGRLPNRVAKLRSLVLRCRWWNPKHPVPNTLTQHFPPHRVSRRSTALSISRSISLQRVHAPPSLHGLCTSNKGSSPSNCPQNRNPFCR